MEKKFNDMYELMDASIEDLTEIEDFGLTMATSVQNYFSFDENRDLIRRLDQKGVNIRRKEEVRETTNRFAGLTFVLTGTLKDLTRSEATELIEKAGGKVSGSVSKKTSYVLVGEDAGSKLDKAKELNIPLLNEEEFLKMLSETKKES